MIPAEGELGYLHAAILGVVEGLTEFLPVSSTGHLIVTNALLGHSDPAFEVAIQAGAITAILVRYWRALWRSLAQLWAPRDRAGGVNLLVGIVAAAVPAAVVGLFAEDAIDAVLFDPLVVAIALVVGGAALLWIERWLDRGARPAARDLSQLTLRDAVVIGCWQILALIPGTSRSGATIVGGLLTGLSRAAAAEFSFLVGLPILYGACVLKVADDFERMSGPMLPQLLIGSAVSFVTALLIVGPFVRFLQTHTFRPFGWYRIAAGIAIAALIAAGVIG